MSIPMNARQPRLSTDALTELRRVLELGEILWSALTDEEKETVRLKQETSDGSIKTLHNMSALVVHE